MPTPGLITLIGSGETAPSGRALYEPAFDRLTKPVKVAVMETPAGFELNSPHVASRISEIDGIPIGNRKFAQGKTLRAKVHAWLATREDPRPMGTAIRARDLDGHGPLSAAFLSWLNRLFN